MSRKKAQLTFETVDSNLIKLRSEDAEKLRSCCRWMRGLLFRFKGRI